MDKKKFIARLKEVVGQSSIERFAQRCDINKETLRRYLIGKSVPKIDTAWTIASVAGVSLSWLIGETNEKRRATQKIAASIEPGHTRLNLADQLPINRITPLKLIVEWMNETYDGELGEIMAMQFYDDLKRNYPSFRKYIEKKEHGTNHLDGPPEDISENVG